MSMVITGDHPDDVLRKLQEKAADEQTGVAV
jgi:hypothetical protein